MHGATVKIKIHYYCYLPSPEFMQLPESLLSQNRGDDRTAKIVYLLEDNIGNSD
jgi:hypothetical protein